MFEEIRNTLSGIRSGSLPASSLHRFVAHVCRKMAWLAIAIIFACTISFVLGM